MTPRELIEMLERTLARQVIWIAAAEKKASFVFALNTAMLGVLAAVAPDRLMEWESAPGVLASMSLALGLVSLGYVVSSSFPRTTGPDGSLIFFGGINSRTLTEYTQEISKLTESGYIEDLSNQCHRNAQIANAKYGLVQIANRYLFASVPFWLLALFFQYSSAIRSCLD